MLDRSFLRDSESHEDAFLSSVPVSSVNLFLSHSWSADGLWKQAALCFCCSSTSAYMISLISSVVGASFSHSFSSAFTTTKVIILVFGFVSFLVALFIIPLFKHRNTMVFLDKCCIPQKDPTAKSYGISKLADYLRASDKLLILWSPDYLDRLWCVYELAVFLQTHDEDDVILVNLDHLKLCVSLMLLQFFSILISGVTEFCGYSEHIGFTLSLASSFLIGRGAFVCGEEWQKFCSRVKCFSVHKAKCSSLADYSDLKQLITDFYGSEAEFAAVVKRLWLGEGEGKHLPEWLFAGASLRIISAPYAPVIVCFAVQYIIWGIRGGIEPSVPIYPPGVPYEPLPGKIHTMLWMSRLSIIPVLMLCFRAPLMLLVGHKLATTGWISEKVDKWCRGIAFATCFGVYNCLTQMICGLRISNHPLYWPAISGLTNEASLFVCGIVVVTTVSLILRRSYAYELLRDSS